MADVKVLENDGWVQVTALENAQASFAVDFRIDREQDVSVYLTPVGSTTGALVSASNYTVSGLGAENGATVIFDGGYAPGILQNDVFTFVHDRAIDRLLDYATSGDFEAATINQELDVIFMIMQQLRRDIDRAIRLTPWLAAINVELPVPLADALIGWNGTADGLVNGATLADIQGISADVDAFNVRWLGLKSSDPTLDNDGNPLVNGALIFNTTSAGFKTYSVASSSWVASSFVPTDAGAIDYIQAGTGATTTDVQERLRREIFVDDFGADPTGVADSAAAIQAAVDHAETLVSLNPPAGVMIRFGRGQYKIASGIVIQQRYIGLRGMGAQLTNLFADSGTFDYLFFDGANSFGGFSVGNEVHDMAITWEGVGDKTAGWYLRIVNCREPVVMNCNLENGFNGLELTSCSRSRIIGNHIDWAGRAALGGDGILAQGLAGANIGQHHFVANEVRGGSAGFRLTNGIQVRGCDGCYIQHNHIQGCENDVNCNPAGDDKRDFVDGLFITGNYLDACLENGIIFQGAATTYQNILVSDNYIRRSGDTGAADGYGINIVPDVGTTISGLMMRGNEIHRAWRSGIRCASNRVQKSAISDTLFREGVESATAHGDIILDGDGWHVTGTMHIDGDAVNASAFAIKLQATATKVVIDGVNLMDSTYQNDIIDNSTDGNIEVKSVSKAVGLGVIHGRAQVQTTDATVTTLFSYTPAANEVVSLEAHVIAAKSNWLEGYIYEVKRGGRSAGGTAALVANGDAGINPEVIGEDSTGAQCTWTLSGGNFLLRVTGLAAATINWKADVVIRRIR